MPIIDQNCQYSAAILIIIINKQKKLVKRAKFQACKQVYRLGERNKNKQTNKLKA